MHRRQFFEGTMAGASMLALSLPRSAWANSLIASPAKAEGSQTILKVMRRIIEVNGRAASVFGIYQQNGKPGLALQAGDAFNVVLRNETDEPTIMHWHGLTPPNISDGVPDSPLPLIAARAERSFDFPVGTPGTHWMHAHTLQEQVLLAAPLIVRSKDDLRRDEQEVVIMLHDFSFATPEELFANLKKGGGKPAGTMPMAGMEMPAGMPADLNDIEYDAYLANDRTLDDPEIVAIENGGKVRVRVINAATATAFTMDFGELEGSLVAVDGQDVQPVKGRRFPVSMGQRLDVLLQLPREARAFPVLALREGSLERTGIVLAPPGAAIAKLTKISAGNAPVLDLATEANLRATSPLQLRNPDKMFDMALAGDMAAYNWSLETKPPLAVQRGDRVEITMRNTSMMAHPMHLHGHHFQVVAIDGKRFAGAMRDTVHIPPQRSATIAVDAGNPGQWALHCHHLYHMAAGMMTSFAYVG